MPLGVDPLWILIGGGLLLLVVGGEYLVRAAVSIAKLLGVSPLLIGLTLVGFGTSTPELATSVHAALIGSPGIAIGNIVGSNIANILLIGGLSALLMPVAVSFGAVWRDGFFTVATACALAVVSLGQGLTQSVGVVFLAALGLYVAIAWVLEQRADGPGYAQPADMSLGMAFLISIAAIGVLIVGADFLVEGGVRLAKQVGLSETFIGLTLVAVGTSLPELSTSIIAALRRQGDISVGNILGSNIYNVLGVGGATAITRNVPVPPQIAAFDNFVMIGVSLLLFVWLIFARGVGRVGGVVFITLYVAYVYIIHPSHADGLQAISDLLRPAADVLRSLNP